jgi:F0F1-type ATP synthase membrane subunit b/b'
MSTSDFDQPEERRKNEPSGHSGIIAALSVGLALALIGVVFLWVHSNRLEQNIADVRDGTQTQISKLGDATSALLEQRMQTLNQEMKDAQDNAATAIKRARSEAQKQGGDISKKLQEQSQQVADEITQLKDVTTTADSKITEVSSNVDSVKTDVSGVKDDVSGVKQTVASTKSDLEKTGTDLKRVMGDMGVMSGLIATNSKDLDALRQLGERNYIEFDLTKTNRQQKVGNIVLTLKGSDPKRNRYTMQVLADDKQMEKKDKSINEPVQLYVAGNRQPYEIVVNQVKKDEVVGYLATPKVTTAQR